MVTVAGKSTATASSNPRDTQLADLRSRIARVQTIYVEHVARLDALAPEPKVDGLDAESRQAALQQFTRRKTLLRAFAEQGGAEEIGRAYAKKIADVGSALTGLQQALGAADVDLDKMRAALHALQHTLRLADTVWLNFLEHMDAGREHVRLHGVVGTTTTAGSPLGRWEKLKLRWEALRHDKFLNERDRNYAIPDELRLGAKATAAPTQRALAAPKTTTQNLGSGSSNRKDNEDDVHSLAKEAARPGQETAERREQEAETRERESAITALRSVLSDKGRRPLRLLSMNRADAERDVSKAAERLQPLQQHAPKPNASEGASRELTAAELRPTRSPARPAKTPSFADIEARAKAQVLTPDPAFDWMSLWLDAEAAEPKTQISEGWYREAKAMWMADRAKYVAMLEDSTRSPKERLLDVVREEVRTRLRHFKRGSPLALDTFTGVGTNCVSQTKKLVALFSLRPGLLKPGQTLGIQVFSGHVQAVVVTRDPTDPKRILEVWNPLSNKRRRTVVAPIYETTILANGYLKARRNPEAAAHETMLIADVDRANVDPKAWDPKHEKGSTDSDLLLDLPGSPVVHSLREVPRVGITSEPGEDGEEADRFTPNNGVDMASASSAERQFSFPVSDDVLNSAEMFLDRAQALSKTAKFDAQVRENLELARLLARGGGGIHVASFSGRMVSEKTQRQLEEIQATTLDSDALRLLIERRNTQLLLAMPQAKNIHALAADPTLVLEMTPQDWLALDVWLDAAFPWHVDGSRPGLPQARPVLEALQKLRRKLRANPEQTVKMISLMSDAQTKGFLHFFMNSPQLPLAARSDSERELFDAIATMVAKRVEFTSASEKNPAPPMIYWSSSGTPPVSNGDWVNEPTDSQRLQSRTSAKNPAALRWSLRQLGSLAFVCGSGSDGLRELARRWTPEMSLQIQDAATRATSLSDLASIGPLFLMIKEIAEVRGQTTALVRWSMDPKGMPLDVALALREYERRRIGFQSTSVAKADGAKLLSELDAAISAARSSPAQ